MAFIGNNKAVKEAFMNQVTPPPSDTGIRAFLRLQSAGGIVLGLCAIVAMIIANTPLVVYYDLLIDIPLSISVGTFDISKPLLLWINDGLMAIFFLLVGLELKREFVEGELRNPSAVALPVFGAIGGMAIPAAFYLFFNADDAMLAKGWAIPAATDIAFALGILMLLGDRVPLSLKLFLTSLAIFDDIGAIIIIAIFYTSEISIYALAVAACSIIVLFWLNRRGAKSRSSYLFVGMFMWMALLKSGVHATLAGVILAMFIPFYGATKDESPVKTLEHELAETVKWFILPIFAFANSGVSIDWSTPSYFLNEVTLGIVAGLFFGKQVGVFGFCWLALKLGIAKLPEGMTLPSLYGASILCGVGFTMSLFIGSLAFGHMAEGKMFDERVGIILGSMISGIVGYLVLYKVLPKAKKSS